MSDYFLFHVSLDYEKSDGDASVSDLYVRHISCVRHHIKDDRLKSFDVQL